MIFPEQLGDTGPMESSRSHALNGQTQECPVFNGAPVRKRWLVVAHEASNSGAPRMLLELLGGVRSHYGEKWECEIVMGRGGPLLPDYEKLGAVHVMTPWWAAGSGFWARVIGARLNNRFVKPWRVRRLATKWRAEGPGIVFSNTGTNGGLLASIPPNAGRVISYIHELEYSLRRFSSPRDWRVTLARTDLFLAVSSAAAHDLKRMGVQPERIYPLPNFLPSMPATSTGSNSRMEICRRLGLVADTRLLLGCGHLDEVKGTDTFAEVSRLVLAERPDNVAFLWVGGVNDPVFAEAVKAKGEGRVHYIGEVDSVDAYFMASELVLVTSRVESFSRVALEAGALGRPVLAFAGARGLTDILEPDCLVDEMSASAMAARVIDWLSQPEKARASGAQLRDKIAKEFLAEKWIGETIRIIEDAACV